MEVTDAIKIAKEHVALVFKDEGVFNVGLEEVELNDDGLWTVTIGFSRKWDRAPRNPLAMAMTEGTDDRATARTYKVVEVNDSTGKVVAVRNRPGLK